MGFDGPRFTWSNMRKGVENIQGRLDRAYCNTEWLQLFPNTRISHVERVKSDHNPVFLYPGTVKNRSRSVPFKILAAWYLDPRFGELVRAVWESSGTEVTRTIDCFREVADQWNKKVFGNIFDRKNKYLELLEGIQRKLEKGPSRYLAQLETQLRKELGEALLQEEVLWR